MMRIGVARRAALGQGANVDENMRLVGETSPQKRLITAEEIAALALFLCGDDARGLTMEGIDVTGGALW